MLWRVPLSSLFGATVKPRLYNLKTKLFTENLQLIQRRANVNTCLDCHRQTFGQDALKSQLQAMDRQT